MNAADMLHLRYVTYCHRWRDRFPCAPPSFDDWLDDVDLHERRAAGLAVAAEFGMLDNLIAFAEGEREARSGE